MTKMNMRTRVLLTVLPVAIIPIIIIAIFSSMRLFSKLREQSYIFYSTVLKQVANNFDFIYTQYAVSFVDITNMDNYKKIITHPKYQSKLEESNFLMSLGESGEPKGNTVNRAAYTKFKGTFFILEFDKISLIKNRNYLLNSFNSSDFQFDVEKLKEDRLYKDVSKDKNSAKVAFGKFQEGVIRGFEADKTTVFLFPHFLEDETENKRVMMVIMNKDFIPDIYKDIDSIKYGTLYVLDKYNTILSQNHPNKSKDYYYFDPVKKKYSIRDEFGEKYPEYDEVEKMGIREYNLLNTDPKILELEKVKSILSNIENEQDRPNIVKHNGINYLMITTLAKESEVRLIYFHPLPQIYAPIYNIVFWIFIIGIIIALIVIVISFYFSYKLNNPIQELMKGAIEISNQNYKFQIDTKTFFGEFIDLGNSFNKMINMIDQYSEHLEELVRQRTEELNRANQDLQKAYDENKRELMMAQRIQSTLIPKVFPETKFVDFAGMYLPMEALGGDLYDVHKISETKIGIVILDVCGHGVPAALITTMAKISFNANAKKYDDVKKIMEAVNDEMCDAIQGSGDYFTAFYCIIDIVNKKIQFINASHSDIYILKKNGELLILPQTAPVIGVVKGLQFVVSEKDLEKGDRLVLYTDGVIEARNNDRNLYDANRFREVIIAHKDNTPKDFISFIYNDILTFKNNTPHDDDIAILVADII